jgi:hypothetical protein
MGRGKNFDAIYKNKIFLIFEAFGLFFPYYMGT